MDYESLFTDIPGSLSKISAFLNLSSDAFNWSAEVKSNPFPLENLIHNYAEVVAFFKDKPEFFAMLE
jgi:hypothetical protein